MREEVKEPYVREEESGEKEEKLRHISTGRDLGFTEVGGLPDSSPLRVEQYYVRRCVCVCATQYGFLGIQHNGITSVCLSTSPGGPHDFLGGLPPHCSLLLSSCS